MTVSPVPVAASTVAVVILNYNGHSFLRQFLPSVVAHSADAIVWVADNGSSDESVAFVRETFPMVRLLELPQNRGYAGGYNDALAQIDAEYYVLLNSDVEVTTNWLTPMLDLLVANPTIAACQPKIRSWHHRDQFEYAGAAGGYLDWLGYAFCRGRLFDTLEADTGQYDDNRPVHWATGACLLVRASVFRATGGFDTDFFAHQEEIDWCWRVRRLGYEVWTCGQSVVYHVGAGTLAKTNPHKTFLNYRNSLWMLYKNLPAGRPWGVIFLRLVLDGLSAVRFLKNGEWANIGSVLRAHGAFYAALPRLHRQRRALQQTQIQPASLYPDSIVWQYFGRGRRVFGVLRSLIW